MKGMIAKDIRILSESKSLAVLGLICGIVCLFTMKDPGFLVGYITLITASMGCMSCAYDEMNNGMAYLLTMPCTRTKYVLEKYIFSVVVGGTGWFTGVLASLVYTVIFDRTIIISTITNSLVFLIIALIIPALMIPVVLQFGHARSRIMIYVIIGIMFAISGLLALTNVASISIVTEGVDVTILNFHKVLLTSHIVGIGLAFSFVLYFASLFTSLIILNKKEF